MDRIQRWLKASLEADPAATARQAWFDNLPTEPDALSFFLSIAIKQSETEPWWYDTLIALVQQVRQSPEWEQNPQLPSLLLNWCLGVAVGDIVPPKRRGRPSNRIRDMLICTAVDAYTDPERGDRSCSLSEAYGLVADAAGVDDSVVRKIWQHSQAGKKRNNFCLDRTNSSYTIGHRPTFRETVQWLLLPNCAFCPSERSQERSAVRVLTFTG